MRDSVAKVMLIGILLLVWTVPLVLILGFALWFRSGVGIRTECDRIEHALGFSCAIESCQTPQPGVKRYSHVTLRNTVTMGPLCLIDNALSTGKSNRPHIEILGVSLSEEAWLRLWEICEEWLSGKRDFAAEAFTLTARDIRVLSKLDDANSSPPVFALCPSLQVEFSSLPHQRCVKCQLVCSLTQRQQGSSPDLHGSNGSPQSVFNMVWQSTYKDGHLYLTKQARADQPGIPLGLLKPLWNGLPEIPLSARWAGTIEATVSVPCQSAPCWSATITGKLLWTREELTRSLPSLLDWLDADGSIVLKKVVFVNGQLTSADIALRAGPGQIKRAFVTFLHDSLHTSRQAVEGTPSFVVPLGGLDRSLRLLDPSETVPSESPSEVPLIAADYQGDRPFGETAPLAGLVQGEDVPFQRLALRFDCDEMGVRLVPPDDDEPSWVLLESTAGWAVTISEETLGSRFRWGQVLDHLMSSQKEPSPEHRWRQALVRFLLPCVPAESLLGSPRR